MPNIEIYGDGKLARSSEVRGSGKNTMNKVFDVLIKPEEHIEDLVLKEVIVTIVESATRDITSTDKPFLRVYDSNPIRGQLVAELLNKEMKVDVEFIVLNRFYPA